MVSLINIETLLKSLSRPRASSILVLKFRAVQGCFTWNAYGLLLWLYAPCFRMEHFLYPLSMPMCVHTVAHIAPTVIQNQQCDSKIYSLQDRKFSFFTNEFLIKMLHVIFLSFWASARCTRVLAVGMFSFEVPICILGFSFE